MLSRFWGCQADQCLQYSFKASKVLQLDSMETNQSWSVSDDSLKRYVMHASDSCIQDLLSATLGEEDGWKILGIQGDSEVEISRKWSGDIPVVRGRRIFHGSPSSFKAFATAIKAAQQWDANLEEGRHIKDIHENLSIIKLRFSHSSKPLFKNREFVVYERSETMDDGTLVVAVASLPNEIAKGLSPKGRGKLVRGLLIQSGWVIEKVDDKSNSCIVTYIVQLDPAGWLPKWIINKYSVKLAMSINCLSNSVESSLASSESEE